MFTEKKNVLIDSIYKTVVDFYFKVQLRNQFIKDKKRRILIYYNYDIDTTSFTVISPV